MTVPAARRVWAVVPAAGRGERFASSGAAQTAEGAAARAAPAKQYELLHGVTVLEWSVGRLLAESRIAGVVVAVAVVEVWPTWVSAVGTVSVTV